MLLPERIGPRVAHRELGWEEALLVCADDSEQNFAEAHLKGSISLNELKMRLHRLPKEQNIIFYCDTPGDTMAMARAMQMQQRGFTNAMVLDGGVRGWMEMGYGIVTPLARRKCRDNCASLLA